MTGVQTCALPILLRVLRPVLAQEAAQPEGVELEREEERERDRQDADEPADGALGIAQDEHAEQEQDDENVDDVDRRQRCLDVQRRSLV